MNAKIKAQWITALTDGSFRQGAGQLKVKPGVGVRHCCLGVLCELHAKAKKLKWQKSKSCDRNVFLYSGSKAKSSVSQFGILPEPVIKWAGLPDYNPLIPKKIVMKQIRKIKKETGDTIVLPENFALSVLNDCGNFRFKDIAAMIDEAL